MILTFYSIFRQNSCKQTIIPDRMLQNSFVLCPKDGMSGLYDFVQHSEIKLKVAFVFNFRKKKRSLTIIQGSHGHWKT